MSQIDTLVLVMDVPASGLTEAELDQKKREGIERLIAQARSRFDHYNFDYTVVFDRNEASIEQFGEKANLRPQDLLLSCRVEVPDSTVSMQIFQELGEMWRNLMWSLQREQKKKWWQFWK